MSNPLKALKLVNNNSPARWISERLHAFGQDVGSVIPEGFEAYAKIFHPANNSETGSVSWHHIATANGRHAHPEMTFSEITGSAWPNYEPQPPLWDSPPEEGTLPFDLARTLASILLPYTKTASDCYFAYWESHLRGRGLHPTLLFPDRNYFLLKGIVEGVTYSPFVDGLETTAVSLTWDVPSDDSTVVDDLETSHEQPEWCYQSPSIWWPEERTWCVATEIDFDFTYVGGSKDCIRAILYDDRLEALPITINSRI